MLNPNLAWGTKHLVSARRLRRHSEAHQRYYRCILASMPARAALRKESEPQERVKIRTDRVNGKGSSRDVAGAGL